MKNLCTIALGLLLAGTAGAITVNLNYPTLDIFYLGDLDPLAEGSQVDNFTVTFGVGGDEGGDYDVDIAFEYFGAAGTVQILVTDLLIENVQPGTHTYSLSDFRSNNANFGGFVHSSDTDFDEDVLEDINFTGNSLPSGTYRFTLIHTRGQYINGFFTPGGPPVIADPAELVISEPLSISLQMPWDGSAIANAFPTFTWSGRARAYNLRVAEFNPLVHGSHLEALESEAMWEVSVGDVYGMGLAPTTISYGEEGHFRPLVDGRTYVWNVEAVLNTTSGLETRPSPIWSFVYDTDGDQPIFGGNATYEELLDFLSGFLGGQADEILALLQGMELAGPITIDGREVDAEELARIFNQIASGELNLASLYFE